MKNVQKKKKPFKRAEKRTKRKKIVRKNGCFE